MWRKIIWEGLREHNTHCPKLRHSLDKEDHRVKDQDQMGLEISMLLLEYQLAWFIIELLSLLELSVYIQWNVVEEAYEQ